MGERPFRPEESQWFRSMVELSILFLIAVMMLRGFVLEGYLITTGSMAPGLLGLHRQVECPECGFDFAFGMTFDDSLADGQGEGQKQFARCPNCGQHHINVDAVPLTHGDQLLVHKGVFDLRSPRRWETAVFRNPANPGEAYVKRIVGLPGDELQVIAGDIFLKGRIAQKDLETQRETRIEVFDLAHMAKNDEWQIPWLPVGGWSVEEGQLTYVNDTGEQSPAGEGKTDWLRFRNWRWHGGGHFTEVPLSGEAASADWKRCLEAMQNRPISWLTRLTFDEDAGVLRLQGVMSSRMQHDLTEWTTSREFHDAVFRLAARSHVCPVTDTYGYNTSVALPELAVNDLMIEATFTWAVPPDAIVVEIPLHDESYRVTLDFERQTAVLSSASSAEDLKTVPIPATQVNAFGEQSLSLIVSNFDQQILVALNGVTAFSESPPAVAAPLSVDPLKLTPAERSEIDRKVLEQHSKVAIGVSASEVQITSLKVYRDVFYTPGRRKNGVEEAIRVPSNAYFVLGDNSPVSSDSRNWDSPFVPHKLLVGKPFVVHLPSKPGKVTIGGFQLPIRIPDFERIRYIR